MSYSLYILFGVLPSFIWLVYYLKKDLHPESKVMIAKIFFYGMLIALPTVFIEMGFFELTENGILGFKLITDVFLISIFNIFLGVALAEESLKYLVIREKVLQNREFDEPVDAMIYMITAAMGFAAAENILILFSLGPAFVFEDVFTISFFRFIGATFLHALVSGTIGYFLAISFFRKEKRVKLLILGITIATLLHGLYNFSIIKIKGTSAILIPTLILIGLAVFITFAFEKVKNLKK